MKRIIQVLFFVCAATSIFAQAQKIIGNSYVTVLDNVVVYGVNGGGDIDTAQKFRIPKGSKFYANGFDSQNNLRITFWPFRSGSKKATSFSRAGLPKGYANNYSENKEYIGYWANNKDFIIGLQTFNLSCKFYYDTKRGFTWGVMTLPLKVRIGNKTDRYFSVEENLNLGFSFGGRQQMQGRHEQAFSLLLGVSMTRVQTDSTSIGLVFTNLQSSVASALMFSGGILYQYENFQVGVYVGFDNIIGRLGRSWNQQGKPWVGMGVGFALFSRNGTASGSGTNTE